MRLPAFVRALRPHQWSKNLFVLAALGFAYGDERLGETPGAESLVHTLYAFFAFCLGSSSIYLVNDVLDVESDRAHPTKRRRPIASGEISIGAAWAMASVCAASALGLARLASASGGAGIDVLLIVAAYMVMNLAYSVKLKHVLLVDAFCIATGFIFRVVAGGKAAGTEISHWLVLCTLFLALFLALNKRRAEIALLGDDREAHRKILAQYTTGFLDQIVSVLAACTIICYAMYTVDDQTLAKFGEDTHMIWTVPFVVFGVGRYLYLVDAHRQGGSPTRILLGGDGPFLVNGLLWLAAVAAVVVFKL
jgi:4-hydroxybenzoate polyprenyltransferase